MDRLSNHAFQKRAAMFFEFLRRVSTVASKRRRQLIPSLLLERLEERVVPAYFSLISTSGSIAVEQTLSYAVQDDSDFSDDPLVPYSASATDSSDSRETLKKFVQDPYKYITTFANFEGKAVSRDGLSIAYTGAYVDIYDFRTDALPHPGLRAETLSASVTASGTQTWRLMPGPDEQMGQTVSVDVSVLNAGEWLDEPEIQNVIRSVTISGFDTFSATTNIGIIDRTVTATLGSTVTVVVQASFTANFTDLTPTFHSGNADRHLNVDAGFIVPDSPPETKPEVWLEAARFAGSEEVPSSKLTFDWEYEGGSDFNGSDAFSASLYYSADPLFDKNDVSAGASQTVVADSKFDFGTGVFDFGTNTPLRPDRERPYVLVVLDNGESPPLPADNVKALLLPYVDIKTITADAQVGKKNKWESTLIHETTFVLDAPVHPEAKYQIEYRRLDTPMQGETVAWTKFAESESTTVKGRHRLAGLFEFRAVVESGGVKFTSDVYGDVPKRKPKKPQIDVLFPRGADIAQDAAVLKETRRVFQIVDAMIIASKYQTKWEAQEYFVLNTFTEKVGPQADYLLGDPSPMLANDRTRAKVKVIPPGPDVYSALTHSAIYVVAHFHTHPRLDPDPDVPEPIVKTVGPSTSPKEDYDTARNTPKTIGIGIPALVYDYVGELFEVIFPDVQSHPYIGRHVVWNGHDYDTDVGMVYHFGWQRRVNRKAKA